MTAHKLGLNPFLLIECNDFYGEAYMFSLCPPIIVTYKWLPFSARNTKAHCVIISTSSLHLPCALNINWRDLKQRMNKLTRVSTWKQSSDGKGSIGGETYLTDTVRWIKGEWFHLPAGRVLASDTLETWPRTGTITRLRPTTSLTTITIPRTI